MATVLDTFTDYTYYYELTVPACTSGDELSVAMGNITASVGLVEYGYCRSDYKDLRVAYYNGTTWAQIGRAISGENIYFAAQATHASPVTDKYVVYFGNAQESTTPTSYTITSIQTDDFSGSDVASWLSKTVGGSGTITFGSGLASLRTPANADSAFIYKTAAITRAASWTAEARGRLQTSGAQMALLGIYHYTSAPAIHSQADAQGQFRCRNVVVQMVESGGTAQVYILYASSPSGTFYGWNGSSWSTSLSPISSGEAWSSNYIKARIESNGTQFRVICYKNDQTTAFATTSWVNWSSVYDGGGTYSSYLWLGDMWNNWFLSGTNAAQYDYMSYTAQPAGATRAQAKLHRAVESDQRTLDSSYATGFTGGMDSSYGYDQSSGVQHAIKFTPTTTADYQFFEVYARQAGSTAIQAHDIVAQVYTDNSGVPGTLIATGRMSTLGIEKSSGSFQWFPLFFPSKVRLTASTTYHIAMGVNGSGDASVGLSFGVNSVGTSTTSKRTKSGGAWGSWATVSGYQAYVKVYRGWPAMPSHKVSVTSRTGTTIAEATSTPSWIAEYPRNANDEAVYITEAHHDGTEWRVIACSYEDRVATATQIFSGFAALHGSSLTSLSYYNQNSLIPVPASDGTMIWTPTVYDWTAGSCKGYYRNYLYSTGGSQPRRLYHMTNSGANWYTPNSGGGWATDGEVTYPFPSVGNIINPKAWADGGTTYVQVSCELVSGGGKMRSLRCEKTGTTTIGNAKPIYMDLTDLGYASALYSSALGGHSKTSDGIYHAMMVEQLTATADSYTENYFNTWCADSGDGLIYSPPYVLLARSSGLTNEYAGTDGAAAVGIVGDTNLIYGGIHRYGSTTNPRVMGVSQLAEVNVEVASSKPGPLFLFHDYDGGMN